MSISYWLWLQRSPKNEYGRALFPAKHQLSSRGFPKTEYGRVLFPPIFGFRDYLCPRPLAGDTDMRGLG
jgi:hypothetical protein